MRYELRTNKDGTSYYSFLYQDKTTNKRARLSREHIRNRFGKDILSANEAEQAAKLLDAEYESLRHRLSKRAAWEKEFYDFTNLVERYEKYQKKLAPNSYENNVHYLRHYVMHYFLTLSRCNNIDFWPELYDKFKEWLETEAYLLKKPTQLISYGGKNHCIKALNTFMRQLHREKIIQRLTLCEKFPSYKLNERSIDDVISHSEMERVYESLVKNGCELEAIFYRLLYFTGLRFNEGLGVSISDLHVGQVQHPSLQRLLARHEIEYEGYLVISSQPDHRTRGLRSSSGHINRKPLKGRKKISEKFSRVLAITDSLLWMKLVERYNRQVDNYEAKKWGQELSDYALFDGLDHSTATRRLVQAYADARIRYRSWHCCRHSCATNLIGSTGDYNLGRLWLGHSTPSVIERYVHVHQAIVRMSQKSEVEGERRIKKINLG
jgi:integrase